jgi:hypothetical protein
MKMALEWKDIISIIGLNFELIFQTKQANPNQKIYLLVV